MHTVNSIDEPKYSSCHIDDQAIKQQFSTGNLTVNTSAGGSGCHHPNDDVTDNNMAVIKSEDGAIANSYILPPYLH